MFLCVRAAASETAFVPELDDGAGEPLAESSDGADDTVRVAVARATKVVLAGAPLRLGDRELERAIVTASGGVVFAGGRKLGPRVKASGHELRVDGRRVDAELELVGRGSQVTAIALLPVERYVGATVTGEVPSSWPPEALRAQAVAVRTYVVHQKYERLGRDVQVESSVLDQVFGGVASPAAAAAAADTRGEILVHDHEPIKAFFHSCCAGHTESAADAWGETRDYLPGVADTACLQCPRASWSKRYTLGELRSLLRAQTAGTLRAITVGARTRTGRVKDVVLEGSEGKRRLDGEDLRRLLGYGQLHSRAFWITSGDGGVLFEGRGSGHGVGLCQWGAKGMADAGRSYREILTHYYPGAELRRMY